MFTYMYTHTRTHTRTPQIVRNKEVLETKTVMQWAGNNSFLGIEIQEEFKVMILG